MEEDNAIDINSSEFNYEAYPYTKTMGLLLGKVSAELNDWLPKLNALAIKQKDADTLAMHEQDPDGAKISASIAAFSMSVICSNVAKAMPVNIRVTMLDCVVTALQDLRNRINDIAQAEVG